MRSFLLWRNHFGKARANLKGIVMTQRVADSEIDRAMKIARFAKHQHAVMERVLKGSLDSEEVIRAGQALIGRGGKRITIDYRLSLAEMIPVGRFDWTNDFITSAYFPITETDATDIVVELVHFDRSISSETAVAEMAKRGLRPATLTELLAYGAAFPEDQRKFQIVALGIEALLGGSRIVSCIGGGNTGGDRGFPLVGGARGGDNRLLPLRH